MMEYSLEQQEVSRICLDFAVLLETVDGSALRLEAPFQLVSSDGTSTTVIEPDRLADTGSELVGLLRQRIELAAISESGSLTLQFGNGMRLLCEPDEEYEAWTLDTAAGERAVCLPGGDIAHWPKASQS